MKLADKRITFKLMYGTKVNGVLSKVNLAAIYIKAFKSGNPNPKYINTQIYVEPHQWKDGQVVKHKKAAAYNQELRALLTKLEDFQDEQYKIYKKCELATLERINDQNHAQTFTAFQKNQILTSQYTAETKKAHQTTVNKLHDYWKRDIFFEEIDYNFLKKFEKFLYDQNLHTNTVHKHFKNIRTHINEAIRCDYFVGKNPFLTFKAKRVQTQKDPLTEAELLAMEQWSAPEGQEHLEPIRDLFLLGCYSGLRFSDICTITLRSLTHSNEGLILSYTAKKTKKKSDIDAYLLFRNKESGESKLVALLLKYAEKANGADTLPFFEYSNQYVNRCLKEIFEQIPSMRADLKKKVACHHARHTFATIMANNDCPDYIIQGLLQHSSMKVTQGYINQSANDRKKALEKVYIG